MFTIEELDKKKNRGDWKLVSEKVGITRHHASHAFKHPSSRHHIAVVRALREIVEQREKDLREALGNE